ncbi:MAG TPA: DUF6266 family protein [Puia sp.]|nr:DUF6266 family protein [Puia sp.]
MGTLTKGILGSFRGKVGNMVASTWRGKDTIRSKPGPRKTGFSPEQLQQQARFAAMVKFLKPLSDLLNQVYDGSAVGMTGFNKACSYSIQNGISGAYPNFTINYPMVQLGQGNLPNVESVQAASAAAGRLTLTWPDNSGNGKAAADDKAFVAVYCEALDRWIFRQNAAARSAGTFTLDAPAFSGKPVQTWLGFVPNKGKLATTSLYAGQTNLL